MREKQGKVEARSGVANQFWLFESALVRMDMWHKFLLGKAFAGKLPPVNITHL